MMLIIATLTEVGCCKVDPNTTFINHIEGIYAGKM